MTAVSLNLRTRMGRLATYPVVATPRVMAVTGALFYLTGAVVAIIVALSGPVQGDPLAVLWGVSGSAVLAGVLVYLFGAGWPRWTFHVMDVVGTMLVSVLVVAAGQGKGAGAIAVLFVYVPLDSYFFFPLRSASVYQSFGTACLAFLGASGHLSAMESVGLVLVNSVVAVVVAWLVRAAATAESDPLTGLLNREGFYRAVRAALDAPGLDKLCVGFIDIDNFAAVNAHFGAHHGDRLLKEVATRFGQDLPPGGTLARFGGDGFALLLPGCDAGCGREVLDRLRGGNTYPNVTFSGGVSAAVPGESVSLLVARAKTALMEAKTSGRDRIAVIESDQEALAELARAIDDGQLRVFYQPIVNLQGGDAATLSGAEALVRWAHPERGILPPTEFVELAESGGLIGRLGASVLATACAEAATWPETLKVSVNASGRQLLEPTYSGEVLTTLVRTGLSPHRLVIEVTESTLDADSGPAVANLIALRAAGVRVALDDFGTGYSSLHRLDTLPIDIVKLDRSFVSRLGDGDSPVVAAACAISRALGLRMIAEGIEDPAQALVLAGYGCDEGQGYLYGPPMPELALTLPEERVGI